MIDQTARTLPADRDLNLMQRAYHGAPAVLGWEPLLGKHRGLSMSLTISHCILYNQNIYIYI